MSKTEKFISYCTRNCTNYTGVINKKTCEGYYIPWLTPDNARKAVEIAKKEVIEKTIGWIEEFNNHHHIIRYSDSCEPTISELIEWFKNYMKSNAS